LHTGGRPLFAAAARRRSGAPVGAFVPPSGLPEQPVFELDVAGLPAVAEARPELVQDEFTTAGPDGAQPVMSSNGYASTSAR
ncbi:MFS transporter, partial [Streptomyces sp. SID14478]|nr:MFS transporter [Streptomyces sp. SID14478]